VNELPKFTFVEKADMYIGSTLDEARIKNKLNSIYVKWMNPGSPSDKIPLKIRFCYHNETHEKALIEMLSHLNTKYRKNNIYMQWIDEHMNDAFDRPLKVMTVVFLKK
jgi:hypothetical protein